MADNKSNPLLDIMQVLESVLEEGDNVVDAYWIGYLKALIDMGKVVYVVD